MRFSIDSGGQADRVLDREPEHPRPGNVFSGEVSCSLMTPRPYMVLEANHRQLTESPPAVAVLPWGATECTIGICHGTDVVEASSSPNGPPNSLQRGPVGGGAADDSVWQRPATTRSGRTVSFTTATALADLDDVARSLTRQGHRPTCDSQRPRRQSVSAAGAGRAILSTTCWLWWQTFISSRRR